MRLSRFNTRSTNIFAHLTFKLKSLLTSLGAYGGILGQHLITLLHCTSKPLIKYTHNVDFTCIQSDGF